MTIVTRYPTRKRTNSFPPIPGSRWFFRRIYALLVFAFEMYLVFRFMLSILAFPSTLTLQIDLCTWVAVKRTIQISILYLASFTHVVWLVVHLLYYHLYLNWLAKKEFKRRRLRKIVHFWLIPRLRFILYQRLGEVAISQLAEAPQASCRLRSAAGRSAQLTATSHTPLVD